MLRSTRKQLHLNLIHVYLLGGQSGLQDKSHQLIVFMFDKTGSRSVNRILCVPAAPRGQRKGQCRSRSVGHRDVVETVVAPGGYGAEHLCQ